MTFFDKGGDSIEDYEVVQIEGCFKQRRDPRMIGTLRP